MPVITLFLSASFTGRLGGSGRGLPCLLALQLASSSKSLLCCFCVSEQVDIGYYYYYYSQDSFSEGFNLPGLLRPSAEGCLCAHIGTVPSSGGGVGWGADKSLLKASFL